MSTPTQRQTLLAAQAMILLGAAVALALAGFGEANRDIPEVPDEKLVRVFEETAPSEPVVASTNESQRDGAEEDHEESLGG